VKQTEYQQPHRLLKTAAYFLVLGLCVFIPIRSVLAEYGNSLVKVIPDLAILALAGCYTLSIRFRFKFLLHDFIFLAFLGLAFVSTLLNGSGIMPFIFQVRSIGLYYILYFVIRNLGLGKKELTGIVRVVQLMAVVLFVFALIEKITSKMVLFPYSWAESIIYASNYTRAYSLLNNPNTYALFLDLVILLSIFAFLLCRIKTPFWLYGILGGSLLLTMSRSGLIILGVMLVFLALLAFWKQRKALPWRELAIRLALIAAISGAIYGVGKGGALIYYNAAIQDTPSSAVKDVITSALGIGAMDRFDGALSEEEFHKSSQDGRMYAITMGLKVFRDYPILGTGLGTYGSSASMNYRPALVDLYELPFPFYSDNQLITILVETGAVGALLFGIFLIAILICYRRSLLKLLLCVFFGWFMLFYNIFEVQIGAMLFWTFLSLELGTEPPISLFDSTEKN